MPIAAVALANDQHIAVTVPSEAALVEHKLVPAFSGNRIGAVVNEGHASGGVRGSRQSGVAHVGHPDLDVGLGLGAGSRHHIPAQARHRGGGHASALQFGSEEEVFSQ